MQADTRSWIDVPGQAALRAIVPEPPASAWTKERPALDPDCAAFIAASPFAVLATAGPDGRCDASPRGGPPGFVQVLGPQRIAIPDYAGNRRQDSHRHVLANPHVGLVFIVPGVKETLRLNGRASLSNDTRLLVDLRSGGRAPRLALIVEIETVFVHCGKALHRAELWDPDGWPQGVSLARARARAGAETEAQVKARWQASYENPAELW